MATARCAECHASMPVPPELEATTLRCPYCGATQAVPDLEARRRLLLEHQREARLAEQARVAEAREQRREAREARERRADRREARRGRWGMRLVTLVAVLAAPTIIAVTVFDLPARLGFGASGADRLAQLQQQHAAAGCAALGAIHEQYATGSVSRLIAVEPGCVRVLAAGGDGHRGLSLRLFDGAGAEVARAAGTTDPQLVHCVAAATTLRYEIGVGPASRGRLSHLALACPAEAAPSRPAPAGPRRAAPKR